ncbi:hypothetical protein SESBI_39298 [Sesbania bispinosa]|nr:hypothetical protein SESBI_39298 [Sesbania bispinosa]
MTNGRNVRLTQRRFFRVFRPTERHIRVPSWFARRWGEFMAADVILQDPARNRLRMHVCLREDGINFCTGVEDFL